VGYRGAFCASKSVLTCLVSGKMDLAMQHRKSFSVMDLLVHVFLYSVGFTLFAAEVVYGAILSELAAHLIHSHFVVYVMTALEYVVVVCGAAYVVCVMARDVWENIKRLLK
jgi:hypothetical protein